MLIIKPKELMFSPWSGWCSAIFVSHARARQVIARQHTEKGFNELMIILSITNAYNLNKVLLGLQSLFNIMLRLILRFSSYCETHGVFIFLKVLLAVIRACTGPGSISGANWGPGCSSGLLSTAAISCWSDNNRSLENFQLAAGLERGTMLVRIYALVISYNT